MREPFWTIDGLDAYEILGVDRTASYQEIRRAFRQQSRRHHPDAGGDTEHQTRLNLAHHALSDPDRRAAYDRAAAVALAEAEFAHTGTETGFAGTGFTGTAGTGFGDAPGWFTVRSEEPATGLRIPRQWAPRPPRWSPAAARLAMLFTSAYLAFAVAGSVWVSNSRELPTELVFLICMSVVLACGGYLTLVEGVGRTVRYAVAMGVGLSVCLPVTTLGPIVSHRLSGDLGLAVLVWFGTAFVCLAYLASVTNLSRSGAGSSGAFAAAGTAQLMVLATLLLGGAGVGALAAWRLGVVLAVLAGVVATSLSCAILMTRLTTQRSPRPPGLTALLAGLIPLSLLAVGVAATFLIGPIADWHAGPLLSVWVAVIMTSVTHTVARAGVR